MTMLNDLDKIYDIDISKCRSLKGGYICPVCNGAYKTESTFEKHLSQQSCYNIETLVKDSDVEREAFKWYKEIKEASSNLSVYNLATFRKDRLYKSIIQTVVFCLKNSEDRFMKYLAFMMLEKNYKTVNGALSNMRKESNLRDYRMHLQKTDDIDDELFVSQQYDNLMADQQFLVRSLEKALLSIHTFVTWDVESIMNDMPIEYKERIKCIATLC